MHFSTGTRRWAALLTLLSTPLLAAADGFDCKDILVDGQKYDLGALAGDKTVHHQIRTPPTVHNTTFAINICKELTRNSKAEDSQQCEQGARACALEEAWENGEEKLLDRVVNIAGVFAHHGLHLDSKIERLGHGSSNKDDEEGIRIHLAGGRYPFDDRNGQKQKAIIEFVCNKTLTGNEGFEDSKRLRRDDEDGEDDGDGDDDKKDPEADLPHLDEGKSLQFHSYKVEDDFKVLRLTWQTKYACADAADEKPDEPTKSHGWGFFTWFVIVIFLLAATYIIFGSWLNYNRYGARGWDLIPHGDTIRDLPYILKDFFSSLTSRIQLGNSRGGYSAV